MRDEQKLGCLRKAAQQPEETVNVGIVQRGIDFIQDAKRAGLEQVEGKQERNGDQGLFAAGELLQQLWALPARLGKDLNRGFQWVTLPEAQIRFVALAEKEAKEPLEVAAHLLEGIPEALHGNCVGLGNDALKRLRRLLQIGILPLQELEPFGELLVFVQCTEIDRFELLQLLFGGADTLLEPSLRGSRIGNLHGGGLEGKAFDKVALKCLQLGPELLAAELLCVELLAFGCDLLLQLVTLLA